MGRRLDLHGMLQAIIGTRPDGKPNVYFQPPSTVRMNYPCIVYKRDSDSAMKADDLLYNRRWRYSVTVIDPNPDSDIPVRILTLPLCSFDRHYTAENLNHDVSTIYY